MASPSSSSFAYSHIPPTSGFIAYSYDEEKMTEYNLPAETTRNQGNPEQQSPGNEKQIKWVLSISASWLQKSFRLLRRESASYVEFSKSSELRRQSWEAGKKSWLLHIGQGTKEEEPQESADSPLDIQHNTVRCMFIKNLCVQGVNYLVIYKELY